MAPVRGFIGPAYEGKNPVSANEALINWYLSVVETPGAVSPAELLPTPGVTVRNLTLAGNGRAAFACDGRRFMIAGPTLYEIDQTWTATARGTVVDDGRPAMIVTSGTELCIAAGGSVYNFVLATNTLTLELTGGYTHVGFLDGFFIAFNGGFRLSDLYDGTTWDPTQFADRSIRPDLWQAMLCNPYGYILLVGSQTGENWTNVGIYPFPFAPDRSGLLEEGIAAPFSLKQAGKQAVWLATNANGGYQVIAMQGFTPRRISTHAIEQAIAGYATISDAYADTYESEGHAFYLLSFPSAQVTWCYDFATQAWHQRGSWGNGQWNYWRPAFFCFAFGQLAAIDRVTGAVYEVSDSVATDVDDLPMRRVRRAWAGEARMYEVSVSAAVPWRLTGASQQVRHNGLTMFYDSLHILMQVGVGLNAGAGVAAADVDPMVMLRASNDFGQTWGSERHASAGKIGETRKRVIFRNLGSCQAQEAA